MMKRTCVSILLWVTAAASLPAQSRSSAVGGVVQDQTGAAIAGASVKLMSTGASRLKQTQSAASGEFVFANIESGEYQLEVSYAGFTTKIIKGIALGAGETQQVTAVLEAGAVVQQVEVAASAQLLQPATATQSATLTSREIVTMPTASRNVTHLIVNQAGVSAELPDRTGAGMQIATTPGGQEDDGSQSINPSVNGARPSNNALSINGVDTTNMLSSRGGLGNNLQVPLDALEAVEVQTALYSAATGRNGGGNIQLITKGGTNEFHGALYHYLQNENLNANEYFLNSAGNQRPRFRRNESGGAIGGPIRRNKTFFFAGMQRTDFVSGYAPNALAAAGLPTGLGDVRNRDTISAAANEWLQTGNVDNPRFAANFLNALRAFPAEQQDGLIRKFFSNATDILANRNNGALLLRQLTPNDIHPVAVNILNTKRNGQFLIPTPSTSLPVLNGNGTYGREFLLQQVIPTTFNSWSGSATIDHNFSDNSRLRLNYIRTRQQIEEAFGWADASPSPTLADNTSYVTSLSDQHVISPNLTNDFRAGFFELYNTRISKFRDITNSSLGIFNPIEQAIGGLAALMPTIDINTQRNSGGIGNAWDFFDRQRNWYASDAVNWIRGKHSVQFGGEWRRVNIKGEFMSRTNGDLDYNNWVFFFTGHGAASGSSDLDQGDTRRDFLAHDFSLYLQDDWKVTRNFTINFGVRYELFGPLVEKNGRIGNYYPENIARAAGVPTGFQVPSNSIVFAPGFEPSQVGLVVEPGTQLDYSMVHRAKYQSTIQTDRNNLAPRFGFAWQPGFARKLVFRGGYGMFFERPSASIKYLLQRAAPFFIYQNVPAPPDMADPYPRLNVNPFQIPLNVRIDRLADGGARWVRPDGTPFPAQSPFNAKNNTFIDPFLRSPYVQQWTYNIQYEFLPGNLLDMRYLGSRGVGLLGTLNLAQPLDPRETPVNGFTDITNNRGQFLNPDFFVQPEFLGLNRNAGFQQLSNWGKSTYHALQVNWRGRMGSRATYNVAYTFGKTLDTISGDLALVEHDSRRIAMNRGRSDFDINQRLTASARYELPQLLEGSRAGRLLTGGWNLAGLLTWQTGLPFTPLGNAGRNAVFAQPGRVRLDYAPGKTRADAVQSGPVQDRLRNFYDVTAFQDSLDRWGNAGRNILSGPRQFQFDMIVGKNTAITERLRTEFRWEMYNLTNTPSFRNPASTFAANGPGTAGLISRTIGGPRTMQGALRLVF